MCILLSPDNIHFIIEGQKGIEVTMINMMKCGLQMSAVYMSKISHDLQLCLVVSLEAYSVKWEKL